MTTSGSTRRIVIVGGVAAGMATATRLRRRDEAAEIIVLERGGHVSFANCGLAYYLGGVIDDRESLLLQTPERLAARFNIDVRVHWNVTTIDTASRTLSAITPDGVATLEYDELVLATGAAPIRPDIEGAEGMLLLRSIEDTDALELALRGLSFGASVVVVGAGYIGLELAENLTHRGFAVTLVQRTDQVLGTLDAEMAAPVAERLRAAGIDLLLNTTLEAVRPGSVTLDDGSVIDAALAIAAIGVRPESDLARAVGIELGGGGGIRVDSDHRTSAPHVWAVGDVAEKISAVDGEPQLVTLAGPANREGRYLADALAGDTTVTRPALGTAILGVFDLTIGSLGATEREVLAVGRGIRVVHTHPASHATYYPGAETMSIKLIVDATTDLILGAQAVGGAGVDKRIDVISTAMSAGLTASALADLELAYAPQYGSAKDPINMLGFIARNLRDEQSRTIQWHELAERLSGGSTLVDVRSRAEFADGSIPGAVNIPLEELRERLEELPKRRVVVHCQVGQRGHTAARILEQLGFDAVNLDGGYRTWRDAHATRQPLTLGAP